MKFPKYCEYCGYPLPPADDQDEQAGELICPECENFNDPCEVDQ